MHTRTLFFWLHRGGWRLALCGWLLLLTGPAAQAQTWQAVLGLAGTTGSPPNVEATATDASGNVYVAGTFSRTVTIGSSTLTSVGGTDIFVAKWNSITNAFVWAYKAGGSSGDYVEAIALGSNGAVYLGGYFNSTSLVLGGVTLARSTGTNAASDGFVAKLTDAGSTASFIWAKLAGGGSNSQLVNALAVSGSTVYAGGTFAGASNSAVTFDAITLYNHAGGSYDGFVAKLTDAGSTASFTWVQQMTGFYLEAVYALAVSNGGVYAAGSFSGVYSDYSRFGSFTATTYSSSTGSDVFLTKLTDAGSTASFSWLATAGSTSSDSPTAIAVSGSNVYVAGYYLGPALYFDSNTSVSNAGNSIVGNSTGDAFVAKYTDNTTSVSYQWGYGMGGTDRDQANGLAVVGSNVYVAGVFSGTASFGNQGSRTTLGSTDAFVAKLADAGSSATYSWVEQGGGTGADEGWTLNASGSNLYVGGYATPPATFGTKTLAPMATSDASFVARLSDTPPAGPVLQGFSPASGPVGTSVTVTGSGLNNTSAVSFNGTAATGYVVNAAGTQLTVNVPVGATTGPISLATPGGTAASSSSFTVVLVPTIASLTPGSGPVGTSVVIGGANLANASAVTFNGVSAPGFVVNAGGTEVSVSVPAGAGSGVVRVTTPGGTASSPSSFVVIPAPVVSSLAPATGPVGTSVTIRGSNFSNASAVKFNGTTAVFTLNSASQLTATVPAGATTGSVAVTTPGGTGTSSTSFTVTAAAGPAVVSVAAPAAGNYRLGDVLNFTVAFDGAVAVAGIPTLGVVLGSNTRPAAYQSGSGTAALVFRYTVADPDLDLNGLELAPALTLNGGTLTDAATSTNPADLTLRGVPATSGLLVDGVRPYLAGVVRLNPATTTVTGPEVTFRATFNEAVTGVGAASFAAVGTGGVGGTVSAVSPAGGAGTTYDVTLTGVNGDGTLRLSAPGTGPAIKDAFNNELLAGATAVGDTYTVIPGNLTVSTPQSASGLYANVTVASGGSLTLTGPLQVRGSTTVRSGGYFFSRRRSNFWRPGADAGPGGAATASTTADPYYQVTGPGSFTVEAGATLSVPDPDGLTLTGASGLVQVTGTRSFSPEARYIYDGDAAQVTGAGLPAQVRGLLLDNAAGLTLSQPLAVAQVLELASGNLATGGQLLTLLSDASGTALVVNTGGVVNGTATVQRYVSAASNAAAGYRHLAAPVAGTTVADLTTGTFTPIVNPAYNTSTTPGTVVPFPTVFFYDQARLTTSPATTYSMFDRGWESPAALSSPLTAGRGYTVRMAGGQVVDFVGALGNGPLPVSLARGPQADAGWALVGNPYPAPLDWTLVDAADRAGLLPTLWVFESTGPYAGRYRTYHNNFGNPVVPLGQAFFVRVADQSAGTTLTFRNGQRLTVPDATPLLRTTADLRPQLHLALQGATSLDDQLIVYCEAGATPAYDPAFDALKLPNSTGLNLAALAGTTPLAINGLPALTAATVVPLQVSVPAAGTYTLRAAKLLNLPVGTRAYLRDAQTGQQLDLQQQPSYSFALTGTSAASRFFLELHPAGPLAAATAAAGPAVQVFPNPARGQCQVLLPAGTGPATLTLYNALGQPVRQQPARTDLTSLDLAGLSTGVYTLRVQAAGTTSTQRLTVE